MNRRILRFPFFLLRPPCSFPFPGGSSSFREARNFPLPPRLTRLFRSRASSLCTPQLEPLIRVCGDTTILQGLFRCLCHLYPCTGSLPRIWVQHNRQKVPLSVYCPDGSRAPDTPLAAIRASPCHFHACLNKCTVSISFRSILSSHIFSCHIHAVFLFPFFSSPTFRVSFSLPSIYERYLYFPLFSVSYATSYSTKTIFYLVFRVSFASLFYFRFIFSCQLRPFHVFRLTIFFVSVSCSSYRLFRVSYTYTCFRLLCVCFVTRFTVCALLTRRADVRWVVADGS